MLRRTKYVNELPEDEKVSYGKCTRLLRCAIVGPSMGNNMKTPLCAAAPNATVARYGQHDGAILHSDKGSRFTSSMCRNVLESKGVTQSMGRTGSCYDDARMEIFFATLKKELICRLPACKMIRARLKSAIFEWIEGYGTSQTRVTCLRWSSVNGGDGSRLRPSSKAKLSSGFGGLGLFANEAGLTFFSTNWGARFS